MQMVTVLDVELLSLTGGNNLETRDAVDMSADQRADSVADRLRLLTLWQIVKGRGCNGLLHLCDFNSSLAMALTSDKLSSSFVECV